MHQYWICVAFLIAIVGFAPGCKRKAPDAGRIDLQALGVGMGRELCAELKEGDTVVVVGMPGAVGFVADIVNESIKGIMLAAKQCRVNVVQAIYTKEEIDAYYNLPCNMLHSEFAAGAIERAGAGGYQAVVSFVGPPSKPFLPPGVVLGLLEWNPEARPGALRDYPKVIYVVARDFSARASGPLIVSKNMDEALAWFDQRFMVKKFIK